MKGIGLLLSLVTISGLAHADDVPALPDPLKTLEGETVNSREMWEQKRRPEVLELFQKHVYGRVPDATSKIAFNVFDDEDKALDGAAIRRQVTISITGARGTVQWDLLMYLPQIAKTQPVPVFVLLNFGGNNTVHPDPAIALTKSPGHRNYTPPEDFRGASQANYPIEKILTRGYGMATIHCWDIDPDRHDEFQNGIHGIMDATGERPPDAWGTISAWAWGLSRAMDYFETDAQIDHKHIAVLGHSRLGKTALWAGAQDERFAVVISNNSGCTGAALARRKMGETVKAINDRFPHWFCENYRQYNDKDDQMPVDQHMLISLIAPRPVYVASATEDAWADPEGEFLSCVHAAPVYALYDLKGLPTDVFPVAETPLNEGHIGYHLRTGKHSLTEYDWERYMDYTDRHWKR